MKSRFAGSLLVALSVTVVSACGATPDMLAHWAVSTNAATASNAIAQLRHLGPAGLEALVTAHGKTPAPFNKNDPQWQRLRAAFDAVGGQRDCQASRLFWHKDMESAKAEAQRTGRPILSLRLLGNLEDELSCANSRFFRTTLYANADVSAYLRTNFVLHWKSVRPVPRITIDMGDGRTIERTITGNSIHYVLDSQGRVVDALPGLYGPKAFIAGLGKSAKVARMTASVDDSAQRAQLAAYHVGALRTLNERWQRDLQLASARQGQVLSALPATMQAVKPTAENAMVLTVSKSRAETPMLSSLQPTRAQLQQQTDDAMWARIGALHAEDAKLDARSRELIRLKTLDAKQAMRLALAKSIVEDPLLRMTQNLERSIAEDTVRNEYTLHGKIHEWLAQNGASYTVDTLNAKVYAELFLTPDSDPWLGLVPNDTFSALENGGLKHAQVGSPF